MRAPRLLSALVVLTLLAPVAATSGSELDLLPAQAEEALLQALALAHVDALDLSFNKDYVNGYGVTHDRWRLPEVDTLLAEPLKVPDDAAGLAGAVLTGRGDAAAQVEAAASALGLELPFRVVPPEPKRRDPSSKRWKHEAGAELGPLLAWADVAAAALRLRVEAAVADVPEGIEQELFASFDTSGGRTTPSGEVRRQDLALLAAGDALDLPGLLAAARDLAALAGEIESRASALPAEAWPTEPRSFDGSSGLIVVGTSGVDHFSGDRGFTLLIDPGGGDQHDLAPDSVLSILVELGGDDLHQVPVGVGARGVGVAIEAAGSDQYLADDRTAGVALFGVGLLIDRAGADQHRASLFAQGAAWFGAGMLVDLDGADYFDVGGWGQGAAGVQGYGLLLDVVGDDSYRSGGVLPGWPHYRSRTFSFAQGFATGVRPLAGGGIGLLVDQAGDDAYTADLWGQAASYWFSRGYLVDLGGSDVRLGGHYVQSCPAHLTITGLFDVGGDDRYHCTAGLSQAGSHDYSVAWLVDDGGDDDFKIRDGGQGFSTTNAVAFFVDTGGDDVLRSRADSVRGAIRQARRQGSLAFYLDLGGEDRRDGPGPAEGALLRATPYGLGWDLVDEGAPRPAPAAGSTARPPRSGEAPTVAEPAPLSPELAARVHAACSATSTGATSQRLALEEAASSGPSVLADFLPVLARDHLIDGYCFQGLIRLLRELHPGSEPEIEAAVLAGLAGRPRHRGQRWLLRYLGDLQAKDEAAVAALVEAASAEDPLLRRTVADTLGRLLLDPEGVLDALLLDPEETVRATAVWAIGQTGAPPQRLAAALEDDLFLVRFSAAELVVASEDREAALSVVRAMAGAGSSDRRVLRSLRLELLWELGAIDDVRAAAAASDPWLRGYAEQLVERSGAGVWTRP
jgi:hypothetical protein